MTQHRTYFPSDRVPSISFRCSANVLCSGSNTGAHAYRRRKVQRVLHVYDVNHWYHIIHSHLHYTQNLTSWHVTNFPPQPPTYPFTLLITCNTVSSLSILYIPLSYTNVCISLLEVDTSYAFVLCRGGGVVLDLRLEFTLSLLHSWRHHSSVGTRLLQHVKGNPLIIFINLQITSDKKNNYYLL